MFNAEDIIELEKKWLKYKIKQKSKLYIIIILIITILSFIGYQVLFIKHPIKYKKPQIEKVETKILNTKPIVKPIVKIKKIENNDTKKTTTNSIIKKPLIKELNATKKSIQKKQILVIKNKKPYYFKLEATDQGSELFSSNGFLTLNLPLKEYNKSSIIEKDVQIHPIREIQKVLLDEKMDKKPKISIDMKEIDTISYLKDKYYATSSIVFALMLSEEYYYAKDYRNSLKWSLTANDIDSQNTKSWYWFAKSKVKLNKKEDAIRALKAYLSNNRSKRLSILLNKIEMGDTND